MIFDFHKEYFKNILCKKIYCEEYKTTSGPDLPAETLTMPVLKQNLECSGSLLGGLMNFDLWATTSEQQKGRTEVFKWSATWMIGKENVMVQMVMLYLLGGRCVQKMLSVIS